MPKSENSQLLPIINDMEELQNQISGALCALEAIFAVIAEGGTFMDTTNWMDGYWFAVSGAKEANQQLLAKMNEALKVEKISFKKDLTCRLQ